MESISWKRYDDEFNLSDVLTAAARACVDSRASNPSEFLCAYFAKVTNGDSVDTMQCTPVFSTTGELGLAVSLKLFTHSEGQGLASPLFLPFKEGESCDSVQMRVLTQELLSYAQQHLFPQLFKVGVYSQAAWDVILSDFHVTLSPASMAIVETAFGEQGATLHVPKSLPSALCHAFSVAASVAAAKNLNIVLYRHLRSLYVPLLPMPETEDTSITVRVSPTPVQIDHYVLPQLLLPFFGRAPSTNGAGAAAGGAGASTGAAAAAPAAQVGSVFLHTLYLLPGAAATCVPTAGDGTSAITLARAAFGGNEGLASLARPQDAASGAAQIGGKGQHRSSGTGGVGADEGSSGGSGDANTKCFVDAGVMARIMDAYNFFAAKHPGSTLRADGAFVFEEIDNFTDAVDVAREAVEACGLVAGVDVSFGIRVGCPVVRYNAAEASGTGSTTATSRSKKAAAALAKMEDVLYSLFPGDADITSAQLAEYIRQQVIASGGLIVFLEDTHSAQDVAGLHRMQSYVKEWATVAGRTLYEQADYTARVNGGLRNSWPPVVPLRPLLLGTQTHVMQLCKRLQAHGRCVSLVCDEANSEAIVDLSFGVGARYIACEGLKARSACSAVTRYLAVQGELLGTRAVLDRPPHTIYIPRLPDVPTDPIAEIKRKGDKRKKKNMK